ncbi:MAG: HAMP domain-containing histidine kinase [Anaerolineae bacterium]|nr:HAMP domain-containing histidine kinase [Anaerolineae bacterium]
MRGIRGRLLLSYLFLVIVAVGTIGLSFILILNTRAAPPEPVYQELATIALQADPLRLLLESWHPGLLRDPDESLAALGGELSGLAAEQNVRVLIANLSNRSVVYDSEGRLTGGPLHADIQNYRFPAGLRRGQYATVDALGGSFIDENREWLFVGIRGLPFAEDQYYMLFADTRPVQTLREALSDFGTEILPLLAQAALISVAIAVALSWIISRSIARPLQTMSKAAGAIAAGHYERRIPEQGFEESRDLGQAFNRLVNQVQGEQRSQQDFLVNVSHDLKTPLTSIQGFSQAIVDGAAPDPAKAAQIIYDEAARLNRMVTELTDLARLQAGRLSMNISPLDMGQLTEAIGQRLSIVAGEKGVTLKLETAPMPAIAGDGDRMAQVLTNLLSNAIKFTPAGGMVTARTSMQNNGVVVEISDTGVGMSAEQLPRIFERFYQVDKARGPQRGTGLGLAITQEIVQAHGGTITAGSPGEGKGSSFTLWLPYAQLGAARRRG